MLTIRKKPKPLIKLHDAYHLVVIVVAHWFDKVFEAHLRASRNGAVINYALHVHTGRRITCLSIREESGYLRVLASNIVPLASSRPGLTVAFKFRLCSARCERC